MTNQRILTMLNQGLSAQYISKAYGVDISTLEALAPKVVKESIETIENAPELKYEAKETKAKTKVKVRKNYEEGDDDFNDAFDLLF